jgi:hypothetical protein
MYVKVEFFCIEPKFNKGFLKGDMHIIITIASMTIVSSIPSFPLQLVPMFTHMDSI